MRATIWFVLLFAVAVVAAVTLGTNDGLVTFYWGEWRLDLSLNLFLLLLRLMSLIQGLIPSTAMLLTLPLLHLLPRPSPLRWEASLW